ncbi:hypothetical protein QRD40_24240 [Comamonas sp. Y6]|uniref:CopG family transcriptional regulator n=1 Tax=Comamonas resistens TaxID=3046670 RepID=A0ABY8T0M6_9BURK|nr:hypothetical protein [Comamonas resistens]MDL5039443.1 hypothetical protein [Comamonas resistens]WHS67759.1 hypothetical protein QMY55_11845 [Comamonas resistens]
MSQNSSPDDVPGAKQGTADSLAVPGRVGAGGTTCLHCGKALTPSADVFDCIAGFPFEKCSCRVKGTSSKPRYQFRKSVGLFAFHGEELKAIAKQESRSVESVMRSLIVLGLCSRREGEQ